MSSLITRIFAAATGDQIGGSITGSTFMGNLTWQDIVTKGITWISIIAGILAFFYLVWAGFQYVTSAGNADAAKKGQQGIINALIGIVVIVMAYAIVTAAVSLTGSSSTTSTPTISGPWTPIP